MKDEEKRTMQLKVRITPTERNIIQERAAQLDMNISEFVRMAIYRAIGISK